MGIYSWSIINVPYGNQWRRGRRLFHEFLNVKAVTNYDDYQRKHARRFLSRLAETPDDFLHHAQLCVSLRMGPSQYLSLIRPSVTGALIMEITYGMDIKSHEDKFLQTAEHAVEQASRVMIPGAFLVDIFPIRSSAPRFLGPWALLTVHPTVKHVPEWFPGAGFKHFTKECRKLLDAAVDGPLEYVKESLKVSSWTPRKLVSILWLMVMKSPTEATFPLPRLV